MVSTTASEIKKKHAALLAGLEDLSVDGVLHHQEAGEVECTDAWVRRGRASRDMLRTKRRSSSGRCHILCSV
jgi:hypothetical protein